MRFIIALLAALGLGLAATGIIYVLVNMASGTNKVSTATAEIGTLAQNIPTDDGGMAGVANITTAMVIHDQDAPSNMVSGNSLVNPWGGQVTVTPDASPGLFDINDPSIPLAACSKIINSLQGYKTVSINGSSLSVPVNSSTVSQDCQSGGNTLTFAYVG